MTALTCVSSAVPACSVCSFISMMFSMNILFFPHCQAMEGPGTPGSLQHPWDPISLGLGIARTLDTARMLDAAGMLPGFRPGSGSESAEIAPLASRLKPVLVGLWVHPGGP